MSKGKTLVEVFAAEAVNHPAHYNSHPSGVEAIVICREMNFNLGNVVKYVMRAGHKSKDPIEDLRKGAWYLADEIARLEKASKGK